MTSPTSPGPGVPRRRPRVHRDGHRAVPAARRPVPRADRGDRFRAARHPRRHPAVRDPARRRPRPRSRTPIPVRCGRRATRPPRRCWPRCSRCATGQWRGIGMIPDSGWHLSPQYADFDAERRFDVGDLDGARAERVPRRRGAPGPDQAERVRVRSGTTCTPRTPLGATMVSSEGACAAYYRYRRLDGPVPLAVGDLPSGGRRPGRTPLKARHDGRVGRARCRSAVRTGSFSATGAAVCSRRSWSSISSCPRSAMRPRWATPTDSPSSISATGTTARLHHGQLRGAPLFFPGGNIGDLAVNGTVNDLAMSGARPLALSTALRARGGARARGARSRGRGHGRAASRAGVQLVTGDTKVVELGHGDGVYINTAGIGLVPDGVDIRPDRARPGDVVIVSGPIGAPRHRRAQRPRGPRVRHRSCAPTPRRCNGLVAGMLAAWPGPPRPARSDSRRPGRFAVRDRRDGRGGHRIRGAVDTGPRRGPRRMRFSRARPDARGERGEARGVRVAGNRPRRCSAPCARTRRGCGTPSSIGGCHRGPPASGGGPHRPRCHPRGGPAPGRAATPDLLTRRPVQGCGRRLRAPRRRPRARGLLPGRSRRPPPPPARHGPAPARGPGPGAGR